MLSRLRVPELFSSVIRQRCQNGWRGYCTANILSFIVCTYKPNYFPHTRMDIYSTYHTAKRCAHGHTCLTYTHAHHTQTYRDTRLSLPTLSPPKPRPQTRASHHKSSHIFIHARKRAFSLSSSYPFPFLSSGHFLPPLPLPQASYSFSSLPLPSLNLEPPFAACFSISTSSAFHFHITSTSPLS